MGWVIAVLVVLIIIGALAVAVPAVFGVALAGIAPLLIVLLLIGIGGIWWRHSQTRVDPDAKPDQGGPEDA